MREKLLWSAVTLLGLALVASHAQTPVRSESQIGRFQIVVTQPSATDAVQVLRLDTITVKLGLKRRKTRKYFGQIQSRNLRKFDRTQDLPFHRALAPLAAICARFLAGSAAARARPPLRPSATAAGSFLAGGWTLGDSPMDSRKT